MNIDLGMSTLKKKVRQDLVFTENRGFEAQMVTIPKEYPGPSF